MKQNEFSIVQYTESYSPELLRLLMQLHGTYFAKHASSETQTAGEEKELRKSYEDYISQINNDLTDTWKILLANHQSNKTIGFIIGSISEDEYLVRNIIGKFEDWYVEDEYRGLGIGTRLYNELEQWFRSRGCQQVSSETWHGNEISIKAHKKLGFFVSGISFGKLL